MEQTVEHDAACEQIFRAAHRTLCAEADRADWEGLAAARYSVAQYEALVRLLAGLAAQMVTPADRPQEQAARLRQLHAAFCAALNGITAAAWQEAHGRPGGRWLPEAGTPPQT